MRDDAFIVVRGPMFKSSIWPKYGGYFLDLVRYAVFRDTTVPFKDVQVPLARGQCLVPLRFLEKRWGMPRSTVDRLLTRFVRAGLISRKVIRIPGTNDGTDRGTRVTIVNYGDYQLLSGRERKVRDADRDADRDIEVGSMKKEAAAVVASDRTSTPAAEDEVEGLLALLAGVEGSRRCPSAAEVLKLTGVAGAVGWPAVEAKILEVARREMGRARPPVSFAYYIKVLADLPVKSEPKEAAREQSFNRELGEGSVDPSRGAARQVYESTPQEEPELGEGYQGFSELGARLAGARAESEDDDPSNA